MQARLSFTALSSFSLLLLSLLLLSCEGPGGNGSTVAKGPFSFSLEGEFPTCQVDSVKLYSLDGLELKTLHAAAVNKSGESHRFQMQGQLPAPGFYYFGQAPQNLVAVLIGEKGPIKISGNCLRLPSSHKVESEVLQGEMEQLNERLLSLQKSLQGVSRQAYAPTLSLDQRKQLKQQMNSLFQQQLGLLDSLKSNDRKLFADVLALQIVEPFDPENNPKAYANPLYHLAGEFFAYADLSDPSYNYIPLMADQIRSYTRTIYSGSMPVDTANTYFMRLMNRIPEGSQAHKNALAAGLSVLDGMSSIGFVVVAEQYLKHFSINPNLANAIRGRSDAVVEAERIRLEAEKLLAYGAVPPEIDLPTPQGKNMKLSELKGKVVLLDFWASWCRPCRMENPNVVRMYQKYKSQGFTVFSVSLDRDRASWLKGIEEDNMDWYHVSDLKYFQSEAARTYSINAIPATFLLDRKGRIIGKNLRGPALEAKLKEVFN